jgi:CopA family copper-resistance protein
VDTWFGYFQEHNMKISKAIYASSLMRAGVTRRTFVTGLAATGLVGAVAPGRAIAQQSYLAGNRFDLSLGYQAVNLTGASRQATLINGELPGPILRWKEGEEITLSVRNNLAADSSIHWHGIILPPEMDGVPGISFAGIRPGETFDYRFRVMQSGTYWYHSHSEFQEQTGLYGAIVIDPSEPMPYSYDREYVLMLSDWSDERPENIFARLKKESHYYNTNKRTLGDLRDDLADNGWSATWRDRSMWNQMRMNDRDISDVTGATYTFLVNGQSPDQNWTGLFARGEKVLLRIINASAMSIFDFRIPGLKMKVVATDGQYIEPVSVDEIRLGTAETYDVLVEPDEGAYTLFAQAIDRSGFARATLAEAAGLTAPIPDLDPPIILTHADMGMGGHSGHAGHGGHGGHGGHTAASGTGHKQHGQMDHSQHTGHKREQLGRAGFGSDAPVQHAETEYGLHVDMLAEMPRDQLKNPGTGLGNSGRRILAYADIRNLYKTTEVIEPEREFQLHLTGNMERYMWSINGIRFADAEPLRLRHNERVRIVLVNDTMMNHPIHLHGMWSELETGEPQHIPLKHTVLVQPGSRVSYLTTPEIIGSWAYHCHLLYHMMGMFRRVEVS